MYTAKTFCALLDRLTESPAIKPACRSIGIDASNFWSWMAASTKQENERFRFAWGGAVDWLHVHFQTARRRNIVLLESHLRDVLQGGHETTVVHNGQVSYELDPFFVGWTDEEMVALGFSLRERYVLDEAGRAKVLTVKVVPPAHLLIRGAQAYLKGAGWGDTKTVDSNVRVTGGVQFLGKPPEPPAPERKQIAAPQPLPTSDIDAGTERPGDSDLIKDLRARLRAGINNPRPLAPGAVSGRDDDNPELSAEDMHRPRAASMASIPATLKPAAHDPAGPARQVERDNLGVGPDPRTAGGSMGFRTA